MTREPRLGRGLESLLGEGKEEPQRPSVAKREVPVNLVRANPLQPRTAFQAREMSQLVESVKAVGILQPLIVRRVGASYELVAGERRLRAAQMSGLSVVPVVERQVSDDDMLTIALIENLQREDLNPIEKAKGFKRMVEQANLTQEEAARRIGKDRSTIANFIRLLDLPESVQHVVSRGTISMGHARALLGLKHPSAQQALALRIEDEGLSVREVERIVAQTRASTTQERKPKKAASKPAHIRDLEDRAREHLGTKVLIEQRDNRGKFTIHFYSDDDFQRILDVLGISV